MAPSLLTLGAKSFLPPYTALQGKECVLSQETESSVLCQYNCAYKIVVYVSDDSRNSNRTLPRVWAGGARKQRTGIRNSKTSMVPDPVPSCPIRVQEKQGRKQKQRPILNTEAGQVQGKSYVLVPYCCYSQLQQI